MEFMASKWFLTNMEKVYNGITFFLATSLILLIGGSQFTEVEASSGVSSYYVNPGKVLDVPELNAAVGNSTLYKIFVPVHTESERTNFKNNSPAGIDVYSAVQIGDYYWMSKNLNYETGNSWCYDNNSSNCITHGRLYDWNTALVACPSGWHLPSISELSNLYLYLYNLYGGQVGTALKSPSLCSGCGASGFNGLYSGYYNTVSFYGKDAASYFWTATQYDSEWVNGLYYHSTYVGAYYGANGKIRKNNGASIRCVKN